MRVLAFDVYGTLVDVHGIKETVAPFLGAQSSAFIARWREKTVEYAFRRGLMQHYVDFGECGRQALDFVDTEMRARLTPKQKNTLLESQQQLPAFPDAAHALAQLQENRQLLVAFSNGTTKAVNQILSAAQLASYFSQIVSVDELRTFKPSPAVYAYLTRSVATDAKSIWLISSNAWDVIGAKSAGLHAVWVRRNSEQLFDPWGIEPDVIVKDLTECARFFAESDGHASRA
jgi:2-haloalkanoic acid dehalogenase, type II